MFFEDSENGRKSMWCLFLTTLYHLAAHATISDYSLYDNWKKNKTEEITWKVIDFIEDIHADRYIKQQDEEIWKNIQNVKYIFEEQSDKKAKKHTKPDNSYSYVLNKEKLAYVLNVINSCEKEHNKLVSIADFLYKNRDLVDCTSLPYADCHKHHHSIKFEQVGPELNPSGVFEEQVLKIEELWDVDFRAKKQLLQRYKKHLKNLNFDSVIIPSGNLHNYVQIKSRTLPMLRRVKQQIRMIANITDEPKIDQIGYVDMQMAIQAISSEGMSNEIFEREEIRRGEEAWAILVDRSASMSLRFEEIKEFTVCVSESANELTGKSDAWALYSFDNNFQILKDFKERYNKEVQARIGSLENGGLSLLPDAIELAYRVLQDDPREKKYIFVITDGHATGYVRIQEAFSKIVKKTEISGITLVAIGVSKKVSSKFRNSAHGKDLKQIVAKFITAYRTASSDM
jgi:hypothetical protein